MENCWVGNDFPFFVTGLLLYQILLKLDFTVCTLFDHLCHFDGWNLKAHSNWISLY